MKFTVYFAATGFGLKKDAQILREALQHFGYEVRIVEMPSSEVRLSGLRGLFLNLLKAFNVLFFVKAVQAVLWPKPAGVGIHLESIFYEKLYRAEHHILIPNQEWFEASHIPLLLYLKAVWVKSIFAQEIFAQYKIPVEYIVFFTPLAEFDAKAIKRRDYFFSRTGMSRYRGADTVISAWARHPEWPPLKLVIHPSVRPAVKPDNVEFLDIFPRHEDFVQLASNSLFHIYATEAEGFGHSILEAMGYGALVLVTDAPPMNEIADDTCALMLAADYAGQKSIAPRFAVQPSALEQAVEKALTMSDEEIAAITSAGKQRLLDVKQRFYAHLQKAINSLR